MSTRAPRAAARLNTLGRSAFYAGGPAPSDSRPTMPTKRGGGQPVSRDLVRIIRESSRAEEGATLTEHLQAVEARQAKAVEFYLRACALRLSQAP